MRRTRFFGYLVEPVDEIKRFLLKRRWNFRLQTMVDLVDTKPLKDYVIPTKERPHCSIVHSSITANNFELKPYLFGMVLKTNLSVYLQKIRVFIFLYFFIIAALLRLMVLIKMPFTFICFHFLLEIVCGPDFNPCPPILLLPGPD